MSIFDPPINHLAAAGVQELPNDRAVEDVRLEFKRDIPTKGRNTQETLIIRKHLPRYTNGTLRNGNLLSWWNLER